METDDEVNKVPERTHITHEYLVTTLATLCTSQENVEYIVPCLVENLTTLCESILSFVRFLEFEKLIRSVVQHNILLNYRY